MSVSEVPEGVWGVLVEFNNLARGRENEVQQMVRAWFVGGAEEERVGDSDAVIARLAAARLVAATDRVVGPDLNRRARLAGLLKWFPRLGLSPYEQICLATLILGDWPAEETALTRSLDLVKRQWVVQQGGKSARAVQRASKRRGNGGGRKRKEGAKVDAAVNSALNSMRKNTSLTLASAYRSNGPLTITQRRFSQLVRERQRRPSGKN